MEKSEIILSAEPQFAREVTLSVIYKLPLPIWYSLIPGMFIFDFLRRNRAISHYTKRYLFPRKLALNAAQSILDDEKQSSINKRIQDEIERWLSSQNIRSPELATAQKRVVDELVKHYSKLLETKGNSFNEMIENAYKTGKAFQKHLNDLEKAETQIDQSIAALKNMDNKAKERLKIEAEQVKLRRSKIFENIF